MPPSLTMPLALAPEGCLSALVQDSAAEVGQAVALLLTTIPTERRSEPAYGTPQALGARYSLTVAAAAIAAWEPRAAGAALSLTGAGTSAEAVVVDLEKVSS